MRISARIVGAVAALAAVAATAPALAATPAAFFASPSRNIGCVIIDGTARCDIRTRDWRLPRRPRSCPMIVDFGQGLILTATGRARLVCAGDTAMDPQAPILPYGRTITRGAISCTSARTGMTCRSSRTRHGFFISRQSYRLF